MAAKTSTKASKKTPVSRSAITGHYVKKSTVNRHPNETATQSVTRRRAKKKP